MSKASRPGFQRPQARVLADRLAEPRRHLQVVAGARQVGKTTLVQQVLARAAIPAVYASADEPALRDAAWIAAQWDRARVALRGHPAGAVLALDEVQKVTGWSETVKRLWDEDTRAKHKLRVVLLARDSEASLGRRHPRQTQAPRGAARLGAASHAAGPHRESGRPLRGAAPPALVIRRDAGGVRLFPRRVPLFRRLSRGGAAHRGPAPLAPLSARLPARDDDLPRLPCSCPA